MMEIERRNYAMREFRIADDNDEFKIIGHAAVFDSLSEDLGGFREKIAKGAFRESIAVADVRALFNHDPNFVMGRNRSGTLRLTEDDVGLKIEINPPDTQFSRDIQVSVARGDINQMSFGFYTKADKWEKEESGKWVRTLLGVELFDISVVTYPAYPSTDVAVRSLANVKKQQFSGLKFAKMRLDLI